MEKFSFDKEKGVSSEIAIITNRENAILIILCFPRPKLYDRNSVHY